MSLTCPLCGQSTPSLKAHLSRHLGYAPWRCGLCPAAFFAHGHALRHSLADHPGKEAAFLGDLDEEVR